ncbi:2-oxo acid dehydrogenase subunit E2 [Halegenticoccus tardaugens]|uniref:2-oxo acid dehydrogenase subunit E2 n=1 Tax=Halegenticoccus tardaugens TaxID=2071624 RepID=UPI00100BFC26|nr:2-oxo acid dehydrogenase subunit E2 [Halegenticoccus tardaugens]
MGYVIKMPKLGLEMERGTLLEWHVVDGEAVEADDVVAEVESEKTTAEVTARESGVLRRTLLAAGESVEPGAPIAIVAGADEDVSDLEAEAGVGAGGGGSESATAGATDAGGSGSSTGAAATSGDGASTADAATAEAADGEAVKASPRAKRRADELGVDLARVDGTGPQGSVTESDVEEAAAGDEEELAATSDGEKSVGASPRARRLADDLGIDLAVVDGTGPQGAVTEADVTAAADAATAEATSGSASAEERTVREERPLDGMRRTIAGRLGRSYREAVHVTEHRTADAEALFAAVDAAKGVHEEDVSVNDVLLVALSAALAEHPEFNATFEDDVHRMYESHDVCVAVDVDAGLVAPVVRGVDAMSLDELAAERRRVTERALSGEYTSDDLSGGTFTVSNLGVLGVESFDPVINPPQVAILGVNAVERRAVPGEGGEVVFRRTLPFDLSFDHRVVDGADAARFLGTLVEHVEDPWPLLDGVESEAGGPADEFSLPEGRVSARAESDLSGTVTAGTFAYDFDVTEDLGGDSPAAPRPVDLFLGSLAACLSTSIGVQADIRDLPFDGIDVAAVATEDDRGSVESVDVRVAIGVDRDEADDDVLERLVENGERTCHVSELLREDLPVSIAWDRA